MSAIFVTVTGQEDNLGDSLLRRGYLERMRGAGELHVNVGANSPSYVAGLGLAPEDRVYHGVASWRNAFIRAAVTRKRPSLLLNPGEARLYSGHEYVGRQTRLLATVARRSGGVVVQTGLGIREAPDVTPSSALTDFLKRAAIVTWRDGVSTSAVGIGETSPDWAFGLDPVKGKPQSERTDLLVTMRGDRALPPQSWFDAVKSVATSNDLQVKVISQVQRDNDRALQLSDEFGTVETNLWTSGTHGDRLSELNEMYANARFVVSDRLHALVLGALSAAAPLGWTSVTAEKLRRTLQPAELHPWCADADQMENAAAQALPANDDVFARMQAAHAHTVHLAERIKTTLQRGASA